MFDSVLSKSQKTKKNMLEVGMKVKIDLDKYLWQKDTLTEKFWNFINDNKNTIFTLKEHDSKHIFWEFKEEPTWIFYFDNLIVA